MFGGFAISILRYNFKISYLIPISLAYFTNKSIKDLMVTGQMVGIPCIHASSVIIGKKEKVENYVNEYYTRIRWRVTYRDGIRPVQGMPLWPRLNRLPVLPPPWRRGNPGRPPNFARRKGRNESSSSSNTNKMSREKRIMTCSNCHEEGHNKLGCKNPPVVSLPKKPRGRPRKYGIQVCFVISKPQFYALFVVWLSLVNNWIRNNLYLDHNLIKEQDHNLSNDQDHNLLVHNRKHKAPKHKALKHKARKHKDHKALRHKDHKGHMHKDHKHKDHKQKKDQIELVEWVHGLSVLDKFESNMVYAPFIWFFLNYVVGLNMIYVLDLNLFYGFWFEHDLCCSM